LKSISFLEIFNWENMSLKLFLLLAAVIVAVLAADNMEYVQKPVSLSERNSVEFVRTPSNPSFNTLEQNDVRLTKERRERQYMLANVTAKRASPHVYETFPRAVGVGTVYIAHDFLSNYDACGKNKVTFTTGGQEPSNQMAYSTYDSKLYYLTPSYVRKIYLNGTGDELAFASSLNHGIAIDNVNNIMYLASWAGGKIQKLHLDGTVIIGDMAPNAKSPEQIALSGDYLYWVDETLKSVEKMKTDGTNHVVLKSGSPLSGPQGVVVHNGIVYVSDYLEDAIFSMKLDGSDFKQLIYVKSSAIAGLAIDTRNNLLYFADWGNDAVGVADLDTLKCYAHLVTDITNGIVTPDGIYIDQSGSAADMSTGCNTCNGQAVPSSFVIPTSCESITDSYDCYISENYGLSCTYCYVAEKCIASSETCPSSTVSSSSSGCS
jgi:sugar lactone lactonase YvrE